MDLFNRGAVYLCLGFSYPLEDRDRVSFDKIGEVAFLNQVANVRQALWLRMLIFRLFVVMAAFTLFAMLGLVVVGVTGTYVAIPFMFVGMVKMIRLFAVRIRRVFQMG